ncbi:MAG: PEP/pyruvate-binding domain-containing protein [Chlorobiota bacterium]
MKEKKERVLPNKPEWKIVLDHLVYQDNSILYKLCRKMIIHLERMKIPEIYFLIEELNPTVSDDSQSQNVGPNWPKPKGNPLIPREIIKKVFDIADKYIPDDELTQQITQWLHKEKLSNLSKILEKRQAPLVDVIDALKTYFQHGGSKEFTSVDERVGVRVAIIYRFLSENLKYINIAKHYITLMAIEKIFERFLGPAYGYGKVGGKSAGMILAAQILDVKKQKIPVLENVKTPKSWFLTSDGILEFINYNALDEFNYVKYQSLENINLEFSFIEYVFKNSKFTPEAINAFNIILDDLEGKPIVVRSSSLLEDSFEAAFTGKYKSLFISNVGTKEERLNSLTNAIAEVYASTLGPDPIQYRKQQELLDFREEMGVLIQGVVGSQLGKYFLPAFAGVAMSHNEFRWSTRIKREDGVIRLVAGLGTRAVDRTIDDYPKLISPGAPGIKINQTVKETIRYSQNKVDVINLETNKFESVNFEKVIDDCNGNYPSLEKIVSFIRGQTIVDPVSSFVDFTQENFVITFNGLINNTDFILKLNTILKELSEAYKSPVDIEFASDGETIYLLQCRPQTQFGEEGQVSIPADIDDTQKIFSSDKYINNGKYEDIDFVVYVTSEGYSDLETDEEMREVGKIVSKLNQILPERRFILIGPGRWGSKGDIKLGVPVNYSDINNAAMLIEVARKNKDYVPELSFGTHFFQDLVEANIKYLPLYPDDENSIFNDEFFLNTPNSLSQFINNVEDYEDTIRLINVEHFKRNGRLNIYMDSDNGKALAFVK